MNKKTDTKVEKVTVRLACVYSGDGEAWGIGELIEVDAAEAERLVSLGVAEVV